MEYLIGAAVGIALGGGIGLFFYGAFWRKIIKEKKAEESGRIYTKLIVGYTLIFIVLVLLFLLKKTLPFSYITAFFGAAASFGATEFLHPVSKIMEICHPAEEDAEDKLP